MLLQRVLEYPNRAVWAVGDGMRLVEDSSSVLSVCWKMGCHDAVDLEVPAYLENLVQDAKHRLSYPIVGYVVYVVEDARRLPALVDLYWIRVQRVVELDPRRLDIVDALVRWETGNK